MVSLKKWRQTRGEAVTGHTGSFCALFDVPRVEGCPCGSIAERRSSGKGLVCSNGESEMRSGREEGGRRGSESGSRLVRRRIFFFCCFPSCSLSSL